MPHGLLRILATACLGSTLVASIAVPDSTASAAGPAGPKAGEGAEGAGSPSASESLSERLDRSGGVLEPPANVDPAMPVVPPATSGNMPIIRPPGTPGGNPNVVPK
jgi:hypothetical protein